MALPLQIQQREYTKFIEDTDGKVSVRTLAGVGGATIYAVVNIGAAGVQSSMVTLNAGPNQIGSVTVSNPVQLETGTNYVGLATVTVGNTINSLLQAGTAYVGLATVTPASIPALTTGTNWIGLATVNIGSGNTVSASFSGNVTLNPSPNFIGLATTVIGSAPTLYAVVNTAAAGVQSSMVTLNAGPNYIGLVTTTLHRGPLLGAGDTSALFTSTASGSFLHVGIRDDTGEIALVDSSGRLTTAPTIQTGSAYIGLASVNVGGTLPALTAGTAYIGLTTTTVSNTVNALLQAGVANIGFATVTPVSIPALVAGSAYIGLASVNIGGTLPALSAGTNYIGLASVNVGNTVNSLLQVGTAYVGLASVNIGGSLPALTTGTAYIGLASVNVGGSLPALSTGANYIGLVTIISTYLSTYTSVATIISAIGNVTLLVPPAGQRWIMKDLIIGALGRNEVQMLSGATIVIPYIGLATTGGYIGNFGDAGWRGKSVDDSLGVGLNSVATVSVAVNVRFE